MNDKYSLISTHIWPGQTHFGFDSAAMAGQIAHIYRSRHIFVFTGPSIVSAGLIDPVIESLKKENLSYVIYDKAVQDPNIEAIDVTGRAYHDSEADMIIGVGGGSVIDMAKAVRLLAGGPFEASIADYTEMLPGTQRPFPHPYRMPPMIAVPTTAGTGSEVTPWAVVTHSAENRKVDIGGDYLVPNVALIDPALTFSLSPELTASTGIDALSHCIEAYVSVNENPALDWMILYGIELVGRSLQVAHAQGKNRTSRYDMQLAAMIGGIATTSKGLGACHSLAHPLSNLLGLQHGVACAVMLPYQMEYSLDATTWRYAKIGSVLDPAFPLHETTEQQAERAAETVRNLVLDLGLPFRLRDIGVSEDMIPLLAKNAYQDEHWKSNPKPVDLNVLEEIYRRAY